MKLYTIALVVFITLFFGCTTRYHLQIITIPKGDYSIRVNNKHIGFITNNDTLSITTDKLSTLKPPLIEVKNNNAYGYAKLAEDLTSLNVYKIDRDSGKYKVTFLFDPSYVPKPFTEKDLDPQNGKSFKFNKSINKTTYCIVGCDTNNVNYFGLKRHLERYFESNHYSWSYANINLEKTINDTTMKASYDSISREIWQEASNLGIKYLVLFYGYLTNWSHGVSPSDVGTSLAISSLGTASGSLTGLFMFAYPNGGSVITNPTIYCAIYSVNPNRCIFKGKEEVKSFNDDIKDQVNKILLKLFQKIDILINK